MTRIVHPDDLQKPNGATIEATAAVAVVCSDYNNPASFCELLRNVYLYDGHQCTLAAS